MTQLFAAVAVVAALSQPVPLQVQVPATATHYGSDYNGRPLGCGGTYWGTDPSIAAVGPSRYSDWPCGTPLLVEGPAGSAVVTRQDACPGCGANTIDLSEAASTLVCGRPVTCQVSISEWEP